MVCIDLRILRKSLELYGEDAQIEKLIEEMAELTQALLKSRNGQCKRHRTVPILEETADVIICLETLKIILEGDCMYPGGSEALLQSYIDEKQRRQEIRNRNEGKTVCKTLSHRAVWKP